MVNAKKFSLTCVLTVLIFCFTGAFHLTASTGEVAGFKPIADEMIGSSGITWIPKVSYSALTITVARPNGTIFRKTFTGSSSVYLDLYSIYGDGACDGSYTYELRVGPPGNVREFARVQTLPWQKPLIQTGYFSVRGGTLVLKGAPEGLDRPMDIIQNDDVIIKENLCVGVGCADGEDFAYSTIKLKKHYMEILFEDTSTGTFPSNDWKIQINDEDNGSASYFTICDIDGNQRPFTIKAGAPESSIYVDYYGRLGLGTAAPAKKLQLTYGDTPTIRFDQDSSSGHTAQVWDIGGNDEKFFIRDNTSSTIPLPFKVEKGTPEDLLCLKSSGNVGIGTWSPGYALDIEKTNANVAVVARRTDGVTNFMNATATYGNFGTINNFPAQIMTNSAWRMRINTDNSLLMASGATCTTGGVWTSVSSRKAKENIRYLTTEDAIDALEGLTPVMFNYKAEKEENYVGFIAEDVPDLVASKDRKTLSTMDIVAVLTKVLKEQQKLNREQQETIAELKKEIDELKKK